MPTETTLVTPTLIEGLTVWRRQAKELLERVQDPRLEKALGELSSPWTGKVLKIAFVGDFSRGKSFLINRLLGREIAPTGSLPTTRDFLEVRYGEPETLQIGDGPVEPFAGPWEAGSGSAPRTVQLCLATPWLKELGATLVDTPGLGDGLSESAAAVESSLLSYDAVVVVNRADIPLSLTEAEFMQVVLQTYPGPIFLALTMLDMIPEAERAEVLEAVVVKAAQLSERITVLPTMGSGESEANETALEKVREACAQIALQGGDLRARSECRNLVACLEDGRAALGTRLHKEQEVAAQRDAAAARTMTEMRQRQSLWDDLEGALHDKKLEALAEFRKRVSVSREELIETFLFELDRVPDPKAWVSKDLPFRLRRELNLCAGRMDGIFINRLGRDGQWLTAETQRLFQTRLVLTRADVAELAHLSGETPEATEDNAFKKKWLPRLGVAAATGLVYLLVPGAAPLAIMMGAVAALGVDDLGIAGRNKDREALKPKLRAALEATFHAYVDEVAEKLGGLYDQMTDDLKRAKSAYGALIITPTPSGSQPSPARELFNALTDLQNQLRESLQV